MKTAFVDLDGVVFRSKRALGVVETRILHWVKKKTESPTLLHAREINRNAYTLYGHTYPGIKTMFPESAATLQDFNDYVYSSDTLAEAFELAISDSSISDQRRDFEEFVHGCKESGTKIYVLTNSPRSWASAALSALACSSVGVDGIFCSDDPSFETSECEFDDSSVLKPSVRSFASAAKRAIEAENATDVRPTFYFVDDSSVGCSVANGLMGWNAFLFDGEKHSLSKDVLKWVRTDL
jgi:FMN phosphatase YigB (HAD superfamily)